ncbi:MAG TPA: MBL fold metallo-hydrolase [Verrucomicrobiota bacterium]|nr:MBL fold metallo-hydrolase [Verrucomicrobiota bacterium]HNU51043.1 MBL fold metallo-hydrolase [Verrucomicrobiota bacterium]
MGECTLQCFGVGDGWPSSDRSHSAFLYRLGESTILVDCGEPVGRSLKGTGYSYDAIDRILLTHLHFDHIGGLFMLLQGFWLEGRRRPLTLHLPAEGIAPIRQMLEAGYLFPELFPFPMSFQAWDGQAAELEGGIRVTPVRTSHLDRLRAAFSAKYPRPYAAYALVLEGVGLRIVHTGDVGSIDDLPPLLGAPTDLLVCELAHIELEPLLAFLRRQPIRRVVFVHLERPLWQDLDTTRQRILEGLGTIPFTVARDGDRLDLGSSRAGCGAGGGCPGPA